MRAALLLALLLPTSVAAQIAPGLSGSSSEYRYSGQEAFNTLAQFGTCFAASDNKGAYALVATRPGSIEEAKVYKRLFRSHNQGCLGTTNELRVTQTLVRGAVGEGLYRKSIPLPANLRVSTAPTATQVRNLSDAALCYAASNPDKLEPLMRTKVGSKDEHEIVVALLPEIAGCFPPNALRMPTIDITMMRFQLSEALWKLGHAPAKAAR